MKTPLIKENAKLWQTTVVEVANDDDEIVEIAKKLITDLNYMRGKPTGMGLNSVLELLANLGVYLNEVTNEKL